MKVAVVAGNPKPNSRTLQAAELVVEALTGSGPETVVDVVTLGSGLLGWGDAAVAAAVEAVAGSDLIVVASPTFKATYSGLLKLFLDQFATGEGLRDVVAVPLMLGAAPFHAMAPDLMLKPLLVELGAACPAPGLYLLDSSYASDGRIADYVDRWGPVLRAAVSAKAGVQS
ncbi:MAG TPA: NAD(P)H-dependent oxidoreductase [Nocardia sp.]|uniref:NADPH-dependent FMN reductase n=1 Tax=Nocardia TaxID=1817 RepID=UPI002455C399|nr:MULTISPECIES: NAD(P)H-dependent oxidoreductase [Nocardia]HLS78658.1 NAD(P)H-dependent oxidoreductase [Nocardia sp.]